jgi:hypothetical protein
MFQTHFSTALLFALLPLSSCFLANIRTDIAGSYDRSLAAVTFCGLCDVSGLRPCLCRMELRRR